MGFTIHPLFYWRNEMNGKVAKRLRKEARYKGESWTEEQTFHPVFTHMEKGNKKYTEVTNPIKLKLGTRKTYLVKKDAYKTNV